MIKGLIDIIMSLILFALSLVIFCGHYHEADEED